MGFDLAIFWDQLMNPVYLVGAWTSIAVAFIALIIATGIGATMALMRRSRSRLPRWLSSTYIWFFRAIPALLILLIFWNALPQLIPIFKQDWYNPFVAGAISLGIVEAAFMAEIVRAAISSVDDGQILAGRALSMKPSSVLISIVFPQAARVALPSVVNEFIVLVKYSSLASVISLRELLTTASAGVNVTFRYAEYYAVAIVYYLVIVSIVMIVHQRIERRFTWSSKTIGPQRFRIYRRPESQRATDKRIGML